MINGQDINLRRRAMFTLSVSVTTNLIRAFIAFTLTNKYDKLLFRMPSDAKL